MGSTIPVFHSYYFLKHFELSKNYQINVKLVRLMSMLFEDNLEKLTNRTYKMSSKYEF